MFAASNYTNVNWIRINRNSCGFQCLYGYSVEKLGTYVFPTLGSVMVPSCNREAYQEMGTIGLYSKCISESGLRQQTCCIYDIKVCNDKRLTMFYTFYFL